MDIFQPKQKKKTASFHLTEANLKEVERLSKSLKRSKSEIVDQLLSWGMDRYRQESKKKRG